MWNILYLLTLVRIVSSAYVGNSVSQSDAQSSSTTSVVNSNTAAASYSSNILQGGLSTLPRGPCYDSAPGLLVSSVDPCGRQVSLIPASVVGVDRPAVHFGYDVLPPPGPYHRPNCGCVSRGGCSGEVGLYTREVIHRSDLVCGLRFEACCYDGPFPGVADEFARAAACIPQEQCVRPYGILPTDVRDFGVIAPCPGNGAVRCLIVDSEGLLEFKAALASIEASSHQRIVQTDSVQVAPIHIDVPIQAAVNTGSSSFASSGTLTPVNPPPIVHNAVGSGTYVSSGAVSSTGPNFYGNPGYGTLTSNFISTGTQAIPPPVAPVVHAAAEAHATAVAVPEPVPIPEPVSVPVPVPFVRPPGYFGYPGLGLGFRKHFSFSKNYGFGLFK